MRTTCSSRLHAVSLDLQCLFYRPAKSQGSGLGNIRSHLCLVAIEGRLFFFLCNLSKFILRFRNSQTALFVGLISRDLGENQVSKFENAFCDVAESFKVSADIMHCGFERSIVEINGSDKGTFVEALLSKLQ